VVVLIEFSFMASDPLLISGTVHLFCEPLVSKPEMEISLPAHRYVVFLQHAVNFNH